MATQSTSSNVVEYVFQGEVLPLEQAFAKVSKRFKSFVKEAKDSNKTVNADGKRRLTDEEKVYNTTYKNLVDRLNPYLTKISQGATLDDKDAKEALKIYKELVRLVEKFNSLKKRTAKSNENKVKADKAEKDAEIDYASVASQFKASVQAEQLRNLIQELPGLPEDVVNELQSYITLWEDASKAFKNGTSNAEDLSTATENLDKGTKKYVGSLKSLVENQKKASNTGEYLLQGIISQISSIEVWCRRIKEGISLLGDYIESLNFIEVAINNIDFSDYTDATTKAAEATETFTEKLEQARWALGLDATALNQSAAIFISFGNAIGMTSDDVLEFSENVTQLSVDMASLYNTDVTTMATALKSALAGNTRAMMNYGISVHDATLEEWLYSKGINKTMNDLSETSQAMVRYAYIMEKTSEAQGDLSRTLKSPSNQLKVLKNQVNLLTQNLGSLFNLVIYPAIRMLNSLLLPLNAFVSAMTSIADSNYSQSVGTMTDSTDDLTDSIEEASKAAVGLTGLDEINQENNTTTSIGVDADIQALIDSLGVYEGFSDTTSKLVELMQSLGNALAPVWAMLSDTTVLDGLVNGIEGLLNVFQPLVNLLNTMRDNFDNSPAWLQLVYEGISAIVGGVTSLAEVIGIASIAMASFRTIIHSTIFGNFIKTLGDMWSYFIKLGQVLYAVIARFVTWIATTIKARIESIKTAIANKTLSATLFNVAEKALYAISSFVKLIGKLIAEGAQAVATAIKNLILSKSLWGVALGVIAAAGVGGLAVAAVVGTAVLAAKAIQGSNAASESTIGLATGGVVTGPTLALVGEGKYDEAVVPLGNSPQFQSMKEGIADAVVNSINISSGSTSSSRPIVLNINGKELARTIIPDIKQAIPQVGLRLSK